MGISFLSGRISSLTLLVLMSSVLTNYVSVATCRVRGDLFSFLKFFGWCAIHMYFHVVASISAAGRLCEVSVCVVTFT